MESNSRNLRSQVGKPPIQKLLCRLCECPTSDGHVLASQVDRFKLRKWAMEVMNLTEEDENLPDVVEEDALICYFCIWQAEFGDESGDEAVAWWPKNLDLEENAKVLRENYSVGEVEQCWVQLEEIDLAKYEKKIPKKRKLVTEEEKEQHMQQKRNKPRLEIKKIRCKFCENIKKYFSTMVSWRQHMKRSHPQTVPCTRVGCNKYFKSKPEMILHISSSHRQGINQDLYLCKHCEYFATKQFELRKHVEARHMPKIFKCDRCNAKFGSKMLVNNHVKHTHTLDKCKSCGQDVARGTITRHRKPLVCPRCKLSFECLGLYQSHRKSCKETSRRCKECGKSFKKCYKLKLHVQTVHTKSVIFRCDQCDYSTFNKFRMAAHLQSLHLPKTIKCGECDKWFGSETFLNIHKHRWHEYVRCAECPQEMLRQNMYNHQKVKSCRRCKSKFKCLGLLEKHKKSCRGTLLSCKECGKSFIRSSDFNCHVQAVHTKSANFVCHHCDYTTHDKRRISVHMQRMHLPKKIKCGECDKLFASEPRLKVHRSQHHSFIRCADCAQEVVRPYITIHRRVKACRRCKCELKCSGLLEKHNKSCQSNKFHCDMCPKTFKEKYGLIYHISKMHLDT